MCAMVCINVLHNVHKFNPAAIKFNPARCSVSDFQKTSRLNELEDIFISTTCNKGNPANPLLEAVKKVVPIIKESPAKIAENLHDMIVETSKSASDAIGKDAIVFPIPEHKDLVLRVEKTALNKMDGLSENLELVPISYEKTIADNPHLGLPLYYVTPRMSSIGRKTTISPMEALAQKDKIMVLRRVTGEHPSSKCGEKFLSMIGFENDKNPDPNALNNFSFIFGYVKENFGHKSAMKCLEMFKSGTTEIPAHALGEGSSPFTIVEGKEFYAKYRDFADSYIESLKEISELPQKAYDEAVDFIVSSKNFNVDFQHTNNTFVDVTKQEFNFMDFAYDKSDSKYIYANPVKEFRNVLMGKGFKKIDVLKDYVTFLPSLKYPRDFIITPEDMSAVKKYSIEINNKINISAPEEFRSPKVCS